MKFKLEFASKIYANLDYAGRKLKDFNGYKISEENDPVEVYVNLYIEFNSLEELVRFMEVEGRIVLDEKTLIVYDDYIE